MAFEGNYDNSYATDIVQIEQTVTTALQEIFSKSDEFVRIMGQEISKGNPLEKGPQKSIFDKSSLSPPNIPVPVFDKGPTTPAIPVLPTVTIPQIPSDNPTPITYMWQSAGSYPVNFDDVLTTYAPGPKPTLPTYTAPTLTVPELAPMPGITAPNPVTLSMTTPPTFKGLTLPDFDITLDAANLPTLDGTINYIDNPFQPTVLSMMIEKVRSINNGQMIVPGWVWDGIWSRGAGNLKRQELAALRDADYKHACSGWMLPGIVSRAAADQAMQKAAEALSDLTRENATQQATMYREDMWKAMETGLAIETLLEQVHRAAQERALQLALEENKSAIAVYNAMVQAYQVIEIAGKQALIQLKDLQLRGSLAELQIFESEIKAAGFLLEYDKNQVELYKAEWTGEEAKAQVYTAYAQAINAYVQSQATAVDAYGKQVESNNVILQGWNIEWDAYVKRLKPAELRIQAHEARSSHFGRLVQKYQADIQNASAEADAEAKMSASWLQWAANQVEQYKAALQAAAANAQATASIYNGLAQIYQSSVQAESIKLDAQSKPFLLQLENAKFILQQAIAQNQTDQQYWDSWIKSWTAWNNASIGAYAQLGSAAFAAANYTLGASGSYSNQWGNSYSTSMARGYSVSITGDAGEGAFDTAPPI